ncbi:MAG: hypothetical protein V4510_05995 [bacterium]
MNKPTLVLVTACMLVTAFPASATFPDSDPIPDAAEQLVCGFPAVKNAINMLPPNVLHCDPDGDLTGDLLVPATPPAPCGSCAATDIVADQVLPLVPGIPTPPVVLPPNDIPPNGVLLGYLSTEYRPLPIDRWCVIWAPVMGPPVPVCVDAGPASPLLPQQPPTPIGSTPGIPAGSIFNQDPDDVPSVDIRVHVQYFHDDTMLNQRVGVGPTGPFEPVDLDNTGAINWWATNAAGTGLVVSLTPIVGGNPQTPIVVSAPMVGQAVAAAAATVASLP